MRLARQRGLRETIVQLRTETLALRRRLKVLVDEASCPGPDAVAKGVGERSELTHLQAQADADARAIRQLQQRETRLEQELVHYKALNKRMASKRYASLDQEQKRRSEQVSAVEALASSFSLAVPAHTRHMPDEASIRSALTAASVVLAPTPSFVTISTDDPDTDDGSGDVAAGVRVVPLEVALRACKFLLDRLASTSQRLESLRQVVAKQQTSGEGNAAALQSVLHQAQATQAQLRRMHRTADELAEGMQSRRADEARASASPQTRHRTPLHRGHRAPEVRSEPRLPTTRRTASSAATPRRRTALRLVGDLDAVVAANRARRASRGNGRQT